ncbi:MAG: hypothetical protein M1816_005103 [Peltula sp. TS41687]|nr:MAG: hypothetical protein M1816_005103 [Peltula sp. TS41687]
MRSLVCFIAPMLLGAVVGLPVKDPVHFLDQHPEFDPPALGWANLDKGAFGPHQRLWEALSAESKDDIRVSYEENYREAENALEDEFGEDWAEEASEDAVAQKRGWLNDQVSDDFWSAVYQEKDNNPAVEVELLIESRVKQLSEMRRKNCKAQAEAVEAQAKADDCAWQVKQLQREIARLDKEASKLHKGNRAKQAKEQASDRSDFSLSVGLKDGINAIKSGAQRGVQRSKEFVTGLSKAVSNVHAGSGAGVHALSGAAAAPQLITTP